MGHTTWTYEEDGVAGISYLTQVERAIDGCRAFLLLASHKSVKATQVIREVEQAHEREKTIVPVRLGLSHQQFMASNPILGMATGTAVTVAAEEGKLPAIAKRIAATLSVVYASDSASTPTPQGKQPLDILPESAAFVAAAPIESRVVAQAGISGASALPSPAVPPPLPIVGRSDVL